jgi:hypothetical protein
VLLKIVYLLVRYDASREHAADYINRAHDAQNIPAPLRAAERSMPDSTNR